MLLFGLSHGREERGADWDWVRGRRGRHGRDSVDLNGGGSGRKEA